MVPETMSAVVLTGHGRLERLKYRENVLVPEPEPDDVLIKIEPYGLNNTDICTREAGYSDDNSGWSGKFDFPVVQGGDIAGTIVNVDSNVIENRLGEQVLVNKAIYADAPTEFQSVINAILVGSK